MREMKEKKGSKSPLTLTPTPSSLDVPRFFCCIHKDIPIDIFNFKKTEFICSECVYKDNVDGSSVVQVTQDDIQKQIDLMSEHFT